MNVTSLTISFYNGAWVMVCVVRFIFWCWVVSSAVDVCCAILLSFFFFFLQRGVGGFRVCARVSSEKVVSLRSHNFSLWAAGALANFFLFDAIKHFSSLMHDAAVERVFGIIRRHHQRGYF